MFFMHTQTHGLDRLTEFIFLDFNDPYTDHKRTDYPDHSSLCKYGQAHNLGFNTEMY